MSMHTLTVSEFLNLTNEMVYPLKDVAVEGEVSGYSVRQNKWVFFSLKDEESVLECFSMTFRMHIPLEDGMHIRMHGYPSVYKKTGRFRMTVERVEAMGEGTLKKAYEQLKKKLEREGLFDPSRKRRLPVIPDVIGFIGSKDSAAYSDFMKMVNRRWSGVEVWVYDVRVQGDGAVGDIEHAFRVFNEMPNKDRPDVLVLTRGGGSLEDLWSFNDERVARAVFGSEIPVVCGVGHEKDESLADYCADVRASTPTHAAQLVVPDRQDMMNRIRESIGFMESRVDHVIMRLSHNIEMHMNVVDHAVGDIIVRTQNVCNSFMCTLTRIDDMRALRERYVEQHTQMLYEKMSRVVTYIAKSIEGMERVLTHVNPAQILSRGYSITRDSEGNIITSKQQVSVGDSIDIQLAEGRVGADVKRVQ